MTQPRAYSKLDSRIGKQLGVDPEVILQTSHGRRSVDVIKLYKPELATWDYVLDIEGQIPRDFGQDAIEIAGSRAFLDRLEEVGAPWMIVTSGTRPLVTGWLDVMKLAHPQTLVTAEDVEKGKPDPGPYLLGRQRLGLEASESRLLVLEDAPAGVRAGKAAGFKVVALATTHPVSQLMEAGADWIVKDMRSVQVESWNDSSKTVTMKISDALVAPSR